MLRGGDAGHVRAWDKRDATNLRWGENHPSKTALGALLDASQSTSGVVPEGFQTAVTSGVVPEGFKTALGALLDTSKTAVSTTLDLSHEDKENGTPGLVQSWDV